VSEANKIESLLRCRNWLGDVQSAVSDKRHEQGLQRISGECATGIRHIGDATGTSGFYMEQENLSC
jgi:hypothetical protein